MLAIFAVVWTVDRIIRVFNPVISPLPVTAVLLLPPFLVTFSTAVRYGMFLAFPMSFPDARNVEVLDQTEKVRLYSFLSLVYTLDGILYVFYTHFVFQETLEKLLPWGALFVGFGMAVHFLGALEVEERFRDLLYVIVVTLVALVLAPRIHFLGEVLYALFFFTAVVVAVLLGNLWAFVLQGVLMGGVLLALWRPVWPSPQGNQWAGLHALLVSFGLFFALALYVHEAYRRRLRENQAQLKRQRMVGELASELVDVNRWNFEEEFPKVLRRLDGSHGEGWVSVFLFFPYGKEITGVEKWCYGGIGNPGNPAIFAPEVFSWLARQAESNLGFVVEGKEKWPEGELLRKLGVEKAFFHPVKRGGELLGFLGWGTERSHPLPNPHGELGKVLASVLADFLSRIAEERNIYRMALYDALTGLPNRVLFQDRLEKEIQLVKRTGRRLAVVFVDLDSFKIVNDAEGHEVGDELLRTVASRLAGCVREHDTVARFGGDEFLVLMTQLNAPFDVSPVAERMMSSLREPFLVFGQEFFLTASAGIAIYPEDGETPQDLIKNADLAMYAAKAEKGDGYAFCSPVMKEEVLHRQGLTRGLYRALERGELLLYYQPQVDARTARIVGVEALLRWRHPERGLLLPGTFIPLAEQTGLIIPIGEWVLRTACEAALRWQKLGIPPLRVAVNLSARQIWDPDLPGKVQRVLQETGFSSEYLELEITESTVFRDPERAIGILRVLKDLGVRVALDDFGTGYSCLARLKMFPVDRIKIDRRFLLEITANQRDRAIVQYIIHLAQSLGARVLAEGVETEAQLEFLREAGCEEIQGYSFYPPLPPEELENIFRTP